MRGASFKNPWALSSWQAWVLALFAARRAALGTLLCPAHRAMRPAECVRAVPARYAEITVAHQVQCDMETKLKHRKFKHLTDTSKILRSAR